MHKCVSAYPFLLGLVPNLNHNLREGGLSKVREHALDLARGAITDELKKLEADGSGNSDQARAQKKEHVLVRLRRLLPGAALGIGALQSEDGKVTADASEMAGILRSHWGRFFARRPINSSTLQTWLHDAFP